MTDDEKTAAVVLRQTIPGAHKRNGNGIPTNIKKQKEVWIYKTKNIILKN